MLLAEAKSIYGDGHVGQKHVVPSVGDNDEKVNTNKHVSTYISINLTFLHFSHLEMLPWFLLRPKQFMAMDTKVVNM